MQRTTICFRVEDTAVLVAQESNLELFEGQSRYKLQIVVEVGNFYAC